MNAFEMVIRRQGYLARTYHVTVVAQSEPTKVVESFNLDRAHNLRDSSRLAITELEAKGYRTVGTFTEHDGWGTILLDRPLPAEHVITPVELTAELSSAARMICRRIHLIDQPQTAAEIRGFLDRLVTAAQELRGHVEHLDAHDEDPAAPDYEGVMKRVHGDEDPHAAAVAAVHEVIEGLKRGGEPREAI